jgi:hypothetical protein
MKFYELFPLFASRIVHLILKPMWVKIFQFFVMFLLRRVVK